MNYHWKQKLWSGVTAWQIMIQRASQRFTGSPHHLSILQVVVRLILMQLLQKTKGHGNLLIQESCSHHSMALQNSMGMVAIHFLVSTRRYSELSKRMSFHTSENTWLFWFDIFMARPETGTFFSVQWRCLVNLKNQRWIYNIYRLTYMHCFSYGSRVSLLAPF